MEKVYEIGLKIQPKPPKNIDLNILRKKCKEIISNHKIKEVVGLGVTGSRVWGLEKDYSDIDIIAIVESDIITDLYGEYEGIPVEITTIPLEKIKRDIGSFSYETRWDIFTSVFLTSEDKETIEFAKRRSVLSLEEVDSILSYSLYEISWSGYFPYYMDYKGIKIYSYPERYKDFPKSNIYYNLYYNLNLVYIMQYAINMIPYPSSKWRVIHLDKLKRVSETLLNFSMSYKEHFLTIYELYSIFSKSLVETLHMISELDFLKNGPLPYDKYRKKLILYSQG